MALREQPYIPLYVQDFLSDEKLRECSAESIGVYIMLMCVLHKQKEYGKLLLLQKDNKTSNKITNFAIKLSHHIPFDVVTIEKALHELYEEDVIQIEDDILFQKRMVKDGKLSNKRASAGKKGMKSRYSDSKKENVVTDFDITKSVTTSENEYVYENEDEIEIDNKKNKECEKSKIPKKEKPSKKQYGEYKHVRLTEEQYAGLITDFGENVIADYIRQCDEYVQSTGHKPYNDYNLVLRRWLKKAGYQSRGQPKEEKYDPYSEPIF